MTDRKTPAYRISDLSTFDRPRERLKEIGAGALSTAELIAILLRVGVRGENAVQMGQRLLHDFGDLPGLQRVSFNELSKAHGMGEAKTAQIKAAIELGQRLSVLKSENRITINSPDDAAGLVKYEMSGLNHEELWVILLNTRNNVVFIEKQLYKGSVNSSQVRVGELFRPAIEKHAAALILVHNHPSGDPTPSPEDIALTRAVVQAGHLLDIDVLDHLVIGGGHHVSLKERGVGFG